MYRVLFALALFGCTETKAPAKPQLQAEEPAAAAASPDGPASIKIDPITVSTAAPDIEKGKGIFTAKGCPACHKTDDTKLVGPGLKGVTARRTVPWIQRMVLSPDVMVKEDPVAKQLLATHFTPMPAQGVDPKTELPLLVAYLKSLEK
ncbi:MAG: cytochrome c [Deltaproteobacteria bacterium]|nr:cytochrome c [Deltaproteobacteria bacterium]